VRKWATSEFVKDNDEVNHEVFQSENENDLGVHDNEEEEIAFLDGLLENENFFEINDKKVESLEGKTKEDFETKDEPKSKKELQVVHPDIEILNHFEITSYSFERILKSKRAKTSKNRQETEKTSTKERFEANIESRIKTVVEKRQESEEKDKKALLPDVHHEFLEWRGCSREAKSRYKSRLETLLPKLIYLPQIVDLQLLHKIGCGDEIDQMLNISLKEAQSEEEIFFSVAWVRAFNTREPSYPELCREFYATYKFDEVCAGDELQSKKIISFRRGGRAYSLTLLEFSRRLGLYHADELEEDGFDFYFQGGLRSDENFNDREYWERISIDRHQNGYANMAWVIAKWMKRKGAGSQKDSQICCGQFISKIARKSKVLTKEIVRTLSTPVYCRDLDRTTLRELIDSEDRLIPDIPVDDVLRVATQRAPRVQRASMQYLYERMGSMEIRQEAKERMEVLTTHLEKEMEKDNAHI
ncbi:hypothetical protein Tco_1150569, partial [Tanacetum coccineum]